MGLGKGLAEFPAPEEEFEIRRKKEDDIIVALAGNPNVGKSTVFNALTGLRQHTGNWPGKTVASAQGYCQYNGQGYVMIDTPGCYSLLAHSAEEEVARDFICSKIPDAVVVVCDAVCLERNLNLVLQILNKTEKVVVCINLMDEAAKKHIHINREELEKRLGVPVITVSARNNVGLEGIYRAVNRAVEKEHSGSEKPACNSEMIDGEHNAACYVKAAEELCQRAVSFGDEGYALPDRKKDKVLTGKITAFPIMFLMLLGVFWLTIAGANYPSGLLREGLFWIEERLFDFCIWVKLPVILREMLVHGMYRVVAWVVSVMLPPMAIFFPLFTIMEDSGYLPRVAFNMDKCFRKCHACGKQALTMTMGFGCNAAGVVGCRIIDSPRERLIAVITNNFVPCNGRFPTLIAIITMFFAGGSIGLGSSFLSAALLAAIIIFSLLMTFLVSGFLSATILRGVPSSFVMELPPYRKPQIGKVIVRSVFDRTIFVLGRAVLAAAPAGIIIWILANLNIGNTTLLSFLAQCLEPIGRMIGMDGVILLAFILGLPANEIVVPIMIMAYLSMGNLQDISNIWVLKELFVQNGWTWITAVNVMIFSLMHWPCATSCITIHKETGSMKWTLLSVLIPTVLGITICFLFTLITTNFL